MPSASWQEIILLAFPFYALVFCGYAATRCRFLPHEAISGLSAYVLLFALSAMLFRHGAATPAAQWLDLPLVLLYSLAGLALVAVVVFRRRVGGAKDAAFDALVAVSSNNIFLGLPLIVSLLGEGAVAGVILCSLVDNFIIASLCLSIAQMGESNEVRRAGRWSGFLSVGARSLHGAARNPLLWGLAAGLLFGWSGFDLPRPLARTITLLADSASPVALFTIGALLARRAARGAKTASAPAYWPLALIKLIVHPALVFVLAAVARAMGVSFTSPGLAAVLLAAALPSAGNVSMLAERFGADAGRSAKVILATTSLSFVTFSGMAWFFGLRFPG